MIIPIAREAQATIDLLGMLEYLDVIKIESDTISRSPYLAASDIYMDLPLNMDNKKVMLIYVYPKHQS